MSIVNNDVLGQIKQTKVKKPKGFFPWMLGTIFGISVFMGLVVLKSFVIYVVWNLLLTKSGFPFLLSDSAFGLAAIITILTMKYPGESTLEMVIDLILKSVIFVIMSILFFYF